jgi:hypothetical protein
MEVNSSRIAAGMRVIDGALLVLDLVDDSKSDQDQSQVHISRHQDRMWKVCSASLVSGID